MSAGDAFLEALAQRTTELVVEQLLVQLPLAERQEWFSVATASLYCNVTDHAIRGAIKTGELPKHVRGQRSVALHRDDLDRWMRSGS